jgi:hypothetical protein
MPDTNISLQSKFHYIWHCRQSRIMLRMLLFWVLTPCRLVGRYITNVSERESFHLEPWRLSQDVSPERWYLSTSLHGVKTQDTTVILTTVRTSHLRLCYLYTFFVKLSLQLECLDEMYTVHIPTSSYSKHVLNLYGLISRFGGSGYNLQRN